jgi:UMF1 family MFS transporter
MTIRRSAIAGWVLFDWACQPFFTLVTTFVFAPYVAARLASDPVTGQALWGYATAAAGLVLAAASPLLGSIADATGRRKPWIAGAASCSRSARGRLWFAAPGRPGALALALVAFAVATVAAEVAAVFNNAMMTRLVPPGRLGRLSGLGWAAGYAGGLVSLVIVLGLLAASASTGRTYLGLEPLFGLDPAQGEGDRIVGPLAAVWLALFVWPLFVFTPDAPGSGLPLRAAVADGISRLRDTLADVRARPGLGRFLVANMIYQDGLVALFAFGGIYGSGVFGWGTLELGLFGILLTITGTAGALLGGVVDDRIGARAVILGALGILAFVCLGILSIGREHVMFVVPVLPPGPDDGLFASTPERVFVALGLLIGAVAGPLQASSRSFLARAVPEGDAGRYFGLFALSGKLTSFLAPLAVGLATSLSGTQAAGPAVLLAFLLGGAWLMRGVART